MPHGERLIRLKVLMVDFKEDHDANTPLSEMLPAVVAGAPIDHVPKPPQ